VRAAIASFEPLCSPFSDLPALAIADANVAAVKEGKQVIETVLVTVGTSLGLSSGGCLVKLRDGQGGGLEGVEELLGGVGSGRLLDRGGAPYVVVHGWSLGWRGWMRGGGSCRRGFVLEIWRVPDSSQGVSTCVDEVMDVVLR